MKRGDLVEVIDNEFGSSQFDLVEGVDGLSGDVTFQIDTYPPDFQFDPIETEVYYTVVARNSEDDQWTIINGRIDTDRDELLSSFDTDVFSIFKYVCVIPVRLPL